MLETVLHRAREFLAHHGSHRAAQKTELERARDQIQASQFSGHHDQRVALAGLLLRLREAALVALRIFELERVLRLTLGGQFGGRSGIEKLYQPLAAVDP